MSGQTNRTNCTKDLFFWVCNFHEFIFLGLIFPGIYCFGYPKKCLGRAPLSFTCQSTLPGLFRQVIGIPMGTNCAPLLADLFLYSYENEFLDNMIRSGHRRLARSFNLCYRYIDDLIVFNNKKFLDYLKEIYPSQLTVEKANKSDHLADYLDLTFIIDSGGKLSTRLYDKRDDFDFHIVNFPYLSSNIPSGPSYGVYIS